MHLHRRSSIPFLLFALAAACGGAPDARDLPDAPIQSGEALQVEAPTDTGMLVDTPVVGTPGVTRPARDTL